MAGFLMSQDKYGNQRDEWSADLPGLGRPGIDVYTPEEAAKYGVFSQYNDVATPDQVAAETAYQAAAAASFAALSATNALQAGVSNNPAVDRAVQAAAAAHQAVIQQAPDAHVAIAAAQSILADVAVMDARPQVQATVDQAIANLDDAKTALVQEVNILRFGLPGVPAGQIYGQPAPAPVPPPNTPPFDNPSTRLPLTESRGPIVPTRPFPPPLQPPLLPPPPQQEGVPLLYVGVGLLVLWWLFKS